MSPKRRLVYRFMELPHVHQQRIAERLGIEYDGMTQHDMQVTTLRYASEGHLLETMWEWMNEFDDVREPNPFAASDTPIPKEETVDSERSRRYYRRGRRVGVCIDNTDTHRAWYLHEIAKYPRLTVVYQGALNEHVYVIKVQQGPRLN